MRRRHSFKTIDILFALVLFVIFAVAVLMVLLSGARIYGESVDGISMQYAERTSISYIVSKIRSYDLEGGVRVGEVEGSAALYLAREIDGAMYDTVIYFYDGGVMEYFGARGTEFKPQYGTLILEADALYIERQKEGVLAISYETDEGLFETQVYLRAEGALR